MAIDYYEVLGVEPDAALTIIKRRYRQLVREHHPDVAADRAVAHERIQLIIQAWTVLSDPAERARYDRSRQPGAAPGAASGRSNGAASAGGAAPAGGRVRVDGWVGGDATMPEAARREAARGEAAGWESYRGGHATPMARTPDTSRRVGERRSRRRNAGRRRSNPRSRLLTMVFEAAELYFFHGRIQAAIGICNQVMQTDPKNAEAAALLGDIYAEQGRQDIAVLMYERAVRSQPDSLLYRRKWEALHRSVAASAAAASATVSPGAAPAAVPSTAVPPGSTRTIPANSSARHPGANPNALRSQAPRSIGITMLPTPPAYSGVFKAYRAGGVVLMALATALVIWGNMDPGVPSELSAPIPLRLLLCSTIAAFLLGMALVLMGLVKRCGHVGPDAPAFAGWLMLFSMALVGFVAFPLSFVIYFVLSAACRWWHTSLLTITFATLMLSSTMVLSTPEDSIGQMLQSALFFWSGRAIFPMMLCGWAFGSIVRPR